MNIYKKQVASCIKGIARIDEYLKRLNFAVEDYNASKDLTIKDEKYRFLNVAYQDYLACNSQVIEQFRELHQTHNNEQMNNKQESN